MRALVLGCALATVGGAAHAQRQGDGATLLRTLVSHQITELPLGTRDDRFSQPVLSDSGERIAFALTSKSGSTWMIRAFAINRDGTGQREVDAYRGWSDRCVVDISADGSRVVSSDTAQIRIADGVAGTARELIALDSDSIDATCIAGDGSKVFFLLSRDASVRGATRRLERGLYVIHPDGSGLRQVVGPAEMAKRLGVEPVDAWEFNPSRSVLQASADGSRVLFAIHERLFSAGLDGSGVQDLLGRQDYLFKAGISADGSTMFYRTYTIVGHRLDTGVVHSDGTGRRILTTNWGHSVVDKALSGQDPVQLSPDGSKLLLDGGVLLDTTTGAVLQLSHSGDAFYRKTVAMDDTATRFLYVDHTGGNRIRLGTVELDPANFGSAPRITEAKVDPPFVLTENRSKATVSARVSSDHRVVHVSSYALRDGLEDDTVFYFPSLYDNGTFGDVTAGDGVFTNSDIVHRVPDPGDAAGPRAVRIQAEVEDGDGKRHTTTVEIGPFEVRRS